MKAPILTFALVLTFGLRSMAVDLVAILTELEARYAEDRAVSLRLVLARYADDLERLQTNMLEAGDVSGAARVLLERDRILPALGLPAPPEEEADEFAVFEELPPAPAVPLSAPAATPRDLDALLKTLMPPAPVTTAANPGNAGKPAPSPTSPGRGGRRLLRMANAQLLGTYDPVYGYVYWSAGRSASWTVNDLPPGSYKLQLRYACDSKEGGGKLRAKFGAGTMEVEVPPTGSWKRKSDLSIGPFAVGESRADLLLQPVSLSTGASYLMDLTAVIVLPVNEVAGP